MSEAQSVVLTVSEIASKGGNARAASLTSSERSENARKAAVARWGTDGAGKLPQATHDGELKIGDAEIPCYVLDDGTRIVSTRGIMKALGRTWRGRKYPGTELPVFLEAQNLKSFISSDLAAVLSSLEFKTPNGDEGEVWRLGSQQN